MATKSQKETFRNMRKFIEGEPQNQFIGQPTGEVSEFTMLDRRSYFHGHLELQLRYHSALRVYSICIHDTRPQPTGEPCDHDLWGVFVDRAAAVRQFHSISLG